MSLLKVHTSDFHSFQVLVAPGEGRCSEGPVFQASPSSLIAEGQWTQPDCY